MEHPQKLLDLVDRINNGTFDFDVVDVEDVLKVIGKFKMTHLIDPFSIDEDKRNELIYSILDNPETSQNLYNKLIDRLSDIDVINGEYYLNLGNLQELSELFKTGYRGNVSPRDIANSVLGEDYWEPYWDTTDNVYRDVIESLTPKNMERLKEDAFKTLNNQEIELDGRSSDLMDELAKEQGKEESFVVNSQNIDRIIKDEDTMRWLLKNNLDELNSELYSIHNNAYNAAYTDEYYENVWKELSEFFDTSSKPDWFQWGKKYRVRVKIKEPQLKNIIKDFFYQYKNYSDDFDNQGSFMSLLTHLMDYGSFDWLEMREVDYPDYRRVEEYINNNFSDYI